MVLGRLMRPYGNKNMKIQKIFQKKKFPAKTFILLSMASLFLVFFLYTFFVLIFWYSGASSSSRNTLNFPNQYYLNDEFAENDPLITSVPTLKDMIRGPIISKNDPSLGAENAKVNIVEFSDYQCQFCQKQEAILREVVKEYGDKVRLIWKDFPEENVDSVSFRAAIAGRCAFEQDKFWEFHDLLFKETELNKNKFFDFANQLKLNEDDFQDCLKNNEIIKMINDNVSEAAALNITGVPFVYINDQEVMGEINRENLKQLIDIELNRNIIAK
jgi:predicted DsbA family dithiol-disulfide isomerase